LRASVDPNAARDPDKNQLLLFHGRRAQNLSITPEYEQILSIPQHASGFKCVGGAGLEGSAQARTVGYPRSGDEAEAPARLRALERRTEPPKHRRTSAGGIRRGL